MEAAAHFVPAEEHHGYEGGFHEEGQNALNGQRGTEDVADKPRIVTPVCAEFEFENNACGHSDGEVDAEEFLPELGGPLPKVVFFAYVDGFHDAHDESQTECERHEQPVIARCEGKLRARPVYYRGYFE